MPILYNVEGDINLFNEVISSTYSIFFQKEVINDEMDSIMSNNTWILVTLPSRSKLLGCKWLFRRKYNIDSSIQTLKTRLVTKGFTQIEGIYQFDTYAPGVRITYIRVLMDFTTLNKLHVYQIDVETTFLNGNLKKQVFTKQPKGFELSKIKRKFVNWLSFCMA